MLNQIKKIIVIAGCQRSGTTLTGLILGSHRQAILIDETDGLYEWFEKSTDQKLAGGKAFELLLAKSDSKYLPPHRRITVVNNKRKLLPEIDTIVLKAPNLTYSHERLAKINKDVRIIYPIRDPRAVVASMEKLGHIDMVGNQVRWIEKDKSLANKLTRELEILRDETIPIHFRRALVWNIKSGFSDQFESVGLTPFIFNYEALIADKKNVGMAMAEHVGLPFDDHMLEHEVFYRGMAPGLTERTRPVDQNSIRKWRSRISGVEEKEIMETAGELAETHGYGLGNLEEFDQKAPLFSRETFESPIILTGRGGSGTRLISEIAQKAGVFIGNRLNFSQDSMEWVDLIYEFAIKKSVANVQNKPFHIDNIGLFLDKVQDVLEDGAWKEGMAWGWKLPETILVIPELAQIFPKAKYVHLVRHPVTSSLRRLHMTSRTDNPMGRAVLQAAYTDLGRPLKSISTDPEYLNNAITWLYQVKGFHNFAMENLSADNYHLVRFEDLCQRPVQTSNNLVRFLGMQGHEYLRPGVNSNRLPDLDLHDPAVDEVWDLCGSLACELGYSKIPEGVQTDQRAIAE